MRGMVAAITPARREIHGQAAEANPATGLLGSQPSLHLADGRLQPPTER